MHALLMLAALCADPDIESMKRSLEAQISVFQRLNDLEGRVARLEQKGGDPQSQPVVTPPTAAQDAPTGSAVGVASTPAPAAESATSVCQCQGYKHHLCHCLKAGVKCRCSRTVGSVWNLNEQGRAVSKTGQYADPRLERTSTNEVTRRSDGRWWWHDGTKWRYTRAAPVEGTRYSDTTAAFVYRAGRMQPAGKMAAVIPAGRWVKRCYGGYCRMEWVPN